MSPRILPGEFLCRTLQSHAALRARSPQGGAAPASPGRSEPPTAEGRDGTGGGPPEVRRIHQRSAWAG